MTDSSSLSSEPGLVGGVVSTRDFLFEWGIIEVSLNNDSTDGNNKTLSLE